MKWLVGLSDCACHRRTRRRLSATPQVKPPTPSQTPEEDLPAQTSGEILSTQTPEASRPASFDIRPVTQSDNTHLRPGSTKEQSESVCSAAYEEAFQQLDEKKRGVLGQRQDLEELFDSLDKANNKQKDESSLRKGTEKLRNHVKVLNVAISSSRPFASFEPTTSAALGIVQGVTTLAVGVCGMGDQLDTHIADMLQGMTVILECDKLGQKRDGGENIHKALVNLYKDLLSFYCAVIPLLTKKPVVLAWISEQCIQRIPDVVKDFESHAKHLGRLIGIETNAIGQSNESILIDGKIQRAFASYNIDPIQTHHVRLKAQTANDACKWVLDDPVFCSWYETPATESTKPTESTEPTEPTNPFVLYGEMGRGKSTTMAFMIEHVAQLNKSRLHSDLICYHYCKNDETGQTLYVYATLIQQLMKKKPKLKFRFNDWFDEHTRTGNFSPTHSQELLGNFLFDVIKDLGGRVLIFLDGLDECDRKSRKELVKMLKDQSQKIPGLRYCISARYLEDIETRLEGFPKILIKSDRGRDALISAHKVKEQLPDLQDEKQILVIEGLSELAKGSPIWVQMAVDLLEDSEIYTIAELRQFLRDVLPHLGLSDLYARLFAQVTKRNRPNNAKLLSDALEILATAQRTLSILELGWAVALRKNGASCKTVGELEGFVDTKQLLVFLNPFISIDQSGVENNRKVQLVHESVRELVFQCPPCQWAELQKNSTPTLDEDTLERRSNLHGEVAQDCVKYLLLPEIGSQDLFSEDHETILNFLGMLGPGFFDDSSSSAAGTANSETPDGDEIYFDPTERGFGGLFTYASCYWLHHLGRAERGNGPALSGVITLTTSGSTRSKNWWEQYHRPDCRIRRDVWEVYRARLHPLGIVSRFGPVYLLDELLREARTPAEGELPITYDHRKDAVTSILKWGDVSRLRKLIRFDANENISEAMGLSGAVMLHWSQKGKELTADEKTKFDQIFDHIASGFDVMVEQKWGNEMLCDAAAAGCLPILERLFKAASCNPTLKQEILRAPHRDGIKSPPPHQSVGEAAWNGEDATVAFLLKQEGIEAHLKYIDLKDSNVIHKAIGLCDLETFELLLARYPEGINERAEGVSTPLQLVIREGGRACAKFVKALLEAGADVSCADDEFFQPIRMASRYGDVDVITTLVRVGGADPMSVFEQSQDLDGELDFIDSFDHPYDNEAMMKRVKEALLSLQAEKQRQLMHARGGPKYAR